MAVKHPQFVNGEFYHVVNRGVDKRDIFLDDDDRLRFINSLLVFNDAHSALWSLRGFWTQQRGPSSLVKTYRPKEPLCEIHAFVLMNNHFHLLLRQIRDDGVSRLMRKIGGYAYFFNKKYQRTGTLFQGRFKAILIEEENQLKNTFVYIHTNPIEIVESQWKEFKVQNASRALQFLEKYRWSSYSDYQERANFPTLVVKDFFLELLGGKENCKKEIEEWILGKAEEQYLEGMQKIIIG